MAETKKTAPVQSLQRGLQVLMAVAEARGAIGLTELVRRTGLERSCVFRLVNTLAQQGFLNQSTQTRHYALGPTVWQLAGHMRQSSDLLTFARPHIRNLAHTTGETAHLSVRQGDRAISLEHQTSDQLLGVSGSTGRSEPLHCSAVGKALIGDFTLERITELLDGSLVARTPRTITTVGALFEECQRVLAQGYALDDEEYARGVRCLAAPVRDMHGDIVAAIGVSAPVDRLPRNEINKIAEQVRATADTLSKQLGYLPPSAHRTA